MVDGYRDHKLSGVETWLLTRPHPEVIDDSFVSCVIRREPEHRVPSGNGRMSIENSTELSGLGVDDKDCT